MLKQVLSGEKPLPKVEEPLQKPEYQQKPKEEIPEEKKFSPEELKISWLQFAEKQKIDEPRLYSLLITNTPEIKDDFVLQFSLANRSQESHFNEIKYKLLQFLKKELRNDNIEFDLEVVDNSEQDNKLYTTKDRYDYLVKKNPALANMRQQLTLDID
ncbi:MAG: hypothetical protein U9R19_02215 [Bacteroidota bacterium]|nr:hypothetical protein [Bacteroidota bacterium]